jgi:histidinol-phosphate aminotransferase
MDRKDWLKSTGLSMLGAMALPLYNPNLKAIDSSVQAVRTGPIRMNLNENPYGPSPKVFERFMEYSAEYSQYPGPAFTQLRDMAAETIGCRSECLVVMNGSVEVLKTAGLMAQRRGGTVISPKPTYDNLVVFSEHLGSTVRWIPLDEHMQTDLDAIYSAIDLDTSMIFIANPANPTGLHISHDKLLAFVDSVPKNILVFIDEAYAELAIADDYQSLVPWLDTYPNMIVSRTMSKAYGLAGYRIGYGIANEALATELNALRTTYVTAVGVRAAMAALEDKEWLDRCVQGMVTERERMLTFLRERNVRVVDTQANFVWYYTGMDAKEYHAKFLAEGFILGRSFAPHLDWIRVTLPGHDDTTAFMQAYDRLFG